MNRRTYRQHYRKEWEHKPDFQRWLAPDPNPNSTTTAYCKFCKVVLTAKLSDLHRHCRTPKHNHNMKPFVDNKQPRLNFEKQQSELLKKHETQLRLAMFIAAHTSIRSVDHLSNICNSSFCDSKSAGFKLHRTKCTALITNVLGEHFLHKLCTDIGNSPFSLLIDESTDISVKKMLGLVIRYYSEEKNSIISTFLGMVELKSGKATSIVEALTEYLQHLKLDIKNLIGIASDNASVMTGSLNGVYEILKRDYNLPNLVLVRCVCHSLQLALSSATEKTLPRCLDYLIRETYNWFAQSTLKQQKYADIYKTINDGESPLKIPQMCSTRWISVQPAVEKILKQWIELKTHFQITRLEENCFMAESLYSLYANDENLLYLKFLYPILEEVQKCNKLFESDNADPTKLLESLENLIKNLCLKVLIPSAHSRFDFLSDNLEDHLDPNCYLGYVFESACSSYNLNPASLQIIRERCIKFVIKLVSELRRRIPSNIIVLRNISLLSVAETLKHPIQKKSITELACQFYDDPMIIQKIETQWRNINTYKFDHKPDFKLETNLFWSEVNNYRDAGGSNSFENLCDLAKRALVLPHSNAAVERVFSSMNFFKNKLRNKLSIKTLNSLLHIKFGLFIENSCCDNYNLPIAILKTVGTQVVYENNDSDSQNQNIELLRILDGEPIE